MVPKAAAAAVLAVAATFLPFPPLSAQLASDDGVGPWTEAVVSVTDLEESAAWLVDHGGWRKVASGMLDASEIAYWKLPSSVTGAFLRICAPQADEGCIRYVRFDGVEKQRPIRLAARPWDTGGIFSIMLRTEDARAAFDAAIARGWWAESQPYAFTFGGSDLVNVVIRGPHGVGYALYERKAPPFDGFPVGRLSRGFNAMRMVRDQPISVAYYRDLLGFGVLFDAPFTDPEPRSNNFSVPANLATSLVRRAAALQPVLPGETGRVEVMEFEGFVGRDLSRHASPPNLGIVSLRYPVEDLEAYLEALAGRGLAPDYESDAVTIPGIGPELAKTAIAAFRDPDGNLTEFYDAP
ncbi:MAG: VOC family protein [Erythrobacter sp.]|uniref:VOC family protein n=1 Tax=Erythrobacter sp. TaxID=1042 RepID=UPI0032EE056E